MKSLALLGTLGALCIMTGAGLLGIAWLGSLGNIDTAHPRVYDSFYWLMTYLGYGALAIGVCVVSVATARTYKAGKR